MGKKTLYIMTIVLVYEIMVHSCGLIENGCYDLEIDSLELRYGHLSKSEYGVSYLPYDNQSQEKYEIDQLGFEISISKSHPICQINSGLPRLISKSYADEPTSYYSNKIELISIYSDSTVFTKSQTYAAGTSLIPIFVAGDYGSRIPVLNYLETTNNFSEGETVLLQIQKGEIECPLNQRFTFRIRLSDGKVFDLETDQIITE